MSKATKAAAPTYAFCESVSAGGASRWHVRKLDAAGLKLGGGITTPSLCGRVRPMGQPYPGEPKRKGVGGWDLRVEITEDRLMRSACPSCALRYEETTRGV
jgi:hypothetical protein